MQIFSSVNEFTTKAKNAFLRFPVTLIWAVLGTLFTVWFIDQQISHNLEFTYIKVILTAILGVSWLIATRLLIHYFKEEKNQNKSWLIVFPLMFLAIYYFSLPNDNDNFNDLVIPYRFALFLVTGHLFIFFSPFLFLWNKKAYWNYLKSIFTAFATSAIFSLVLYFGLTIALMALKYLFKFEVKSIRYFELFVLCLGIVNTWIFLSDLPKNNTKQTIINYPKALLVFVKYILIPLTILYLVILYAYSFKILLKWSLPKGWVSYLVVALSVLGFLIHILINPIRKITESRLIKNFYPRFYYALLPMIILLFVAIFKRISEYGFTENRYLVLILSFWILGMTLYILISKRKKLRYFPMSVAVLSLLVSFGFWGIFSVSKNSQAKQFKELYAVMKAKNFEVKDQEKYRFESITRYLIERNALYKVNDVLGYNPMEAFNDKSKWSLPNKLSDSLGIKITNFDNSKRNNYRFYNTNYKNGLLSIKGYDYLKRVYFNTYNLKTVSKFKVENKVNEIYFKLDTINHTTIHIIKQKDTIHKINVKPLINSLRTNEGSENLTQDKLTITKNFDDLNIKILFHSLEIRNKKDSISIIHANATILLKEK